MTTGAHPPFEYDDDACDWSMLYTRLKPLARQWVYGSHMKRWIGEEEAVVEEIVSETVERTFKSLRFRSGEDAPVRFTWSFARQIAYHYFIDLTRKQGKEIPLSHLCNETNEPTPIPDPEEMEVRVHESMTNEQMYKLAVREIKKFPRKQRDALLVDQARCTNFEDDPTPLQLAYQEVGIHLSDYRPQEPESRDERSRHSSLRYCAYKRLSLLPSLRKFLS